MLVTIAAIAVTQSLNPFVVDSDDVVAILAQCVRLVWRWDGGGRDCG